LLGISSPSKVFLGYGENLMQGLAKGIQTAVKLPMNELSNTGFTTPSIIGGARGATAPSVFKVSVTINGNADETSVRNGVRLGIGDALKARGAA